MRYFKIVLACFGFIFTVVGITVGVMFLTGKFDKEVIQPNDIAFDITEKLTEDDFEVVLSTTTENVTETDVRLSLGNQTEKDGYITDGVVTVPKNVKLGTPFVVQVNKTHYEGLDEEWNVGGTSEIHAKSTNPLIKEATPLKVEVDVPVHSLSVEFEKTTGKKYDTVSAKDSSGFMTTLAASDDNQVVELAVGSIVRLKPVFTPAKSSKNTKGENRRVIFEIQKYRGVCVDFVDGENDLIEILRQTTTEDIKINAYCFRTSADEYAAKSAGYSDDELIKRMNENGIGGQSHQIFGTNQNITQFTGAQDSKFKFAINTPLRIFANSGSEIADALDLGLAIASDTESFPLEDKLGVIKLYAYWKDGEEWKDAGDKLLIIGRTSSDKTNGVKAKINKKNANLSSWEVIAGETGTFKLVAKLSYEYFSSSSSTPIKKDFEIEYENIEISEPITTAIAWKEGISKDLTILDGEGANIYYPTINLYDYVDIKNPNATYKSVRFFACPTTNGESETAEDLTNVLDCTLYANGFNIQGVERTVYEIPNGILTVKGVGKFNIFCATVSSNHLGNPKLDEDGRYSIISNSEAIIMNVIKGLKTLDAKMAINDETLNKNTDENTNGHRFSVRQQQKNVFTLSLSVNDIEIFKRDYADGKIHIKFLSGNNNSEVLEIAKIDGEDYVIDQTDPNNPVINFQINVNSLDNNVEQTLKCQITYDIDKRLNKFVKNDGQDVQIKILNGLVSEISFDVVKNESPENTADKNPIEISIKIDGSNIKYEITFNNKTLQLADLLKVSVNEDAINKTYKLESSNPNVIAIQESEEGAKISILGSSSDVAVTITATANDGSGKTAKLYLKVLKSPEISFYANDGVNYDADKKTLTIVGRKDNSITFKDCFIAKVGENDISGSVNYKILQKNGEEAKFDAKCSYNAETTTLSIKNNFGKTATWQLVASTEFGFSYIMTLNVESCVDVKTELKDDAGLSSDKPGIKVYAGTKREIPFSLIAKGDYSVDNLSITKDDFSNQNSGVTFSYESGKLTITFADVEKETDNTITFTKKFVDNDPYPAVYTMKFVLFPNIKSSLTTDAGTEQNPVDYKTGETVIYDAEDGANGLIKLERFSGSIQIAKPATISAIINGEEKTLEESDGKYMLPSSYVAQEGGSIKIKIKMNNGFEVEKMIYMNPHFDLDETLKTRVLYGGKHYLPFIVSAEGGISLGATEYAEISVKGENGESQLLKINEGKITKDTTKTYTEIITSEKLVMKNGNGIKEIPIIILPIDYPFVAYKSIANSSSQGTYYETVDLKDVVESENIYDTLDVGDILDLSTIISLEEGKYKLSIINSDGSTNSYLTLNGTTIEANPVGKEQMVKVRVVVTGFNGGEFAFDYRVKITANQKILVFHPYIEYNEEYDISKEYESLYFMGNDQVSLDLLENFEANKTPNKALLDKLFPTTDETSFARRFVVVREKDGTLIPISNKDLRFEVAKIADDKGRLESNDYASIEQTFSSDGVLESAILKINKLNSIGAIDVQIKAYTLSGAEALYNFKVFAKRNDYNVYYESTEITDSEYKFASKGHKDIDLYNKVEVRVGDETSQTVDKNAYKFHIIINEQDGTDYSQLISFNNGIISISMLVNDVTLTVIVYNTAGEIERFQLTLKCSIDYEIKSSTIGKDSIYDIGESIEFFNTARAENYSMQEIDTTLFVRDHINNGLGGDLELNNLYKEIGGYSIKDISAEYKQYVYFNDIKVYAENLVDIFEGRFFLGDDAKFEIKTDEAGNYISYNNRMYRVQGSEGSQYVSIPISTTTGQYNSVKYPVESGAVVIPHFSFTKGNETGDFVLFDYVEYYDDNKPAEYLPFGTEKQEGEKSHGTYVYESFDSNYIRYKVSKTSTGELKVAMLRLTHNNKQYLAEIDENDHEYIQDGTNKLLFTRFYQINYSGLAQYELDEEGEIKYEDEGKSKPVNNVPYIRYMISKSDYEKENITIDLSKILFFTQGNKNKIEKLNDEEKYLPGMFTFEFKAGEEEIELQADAETGLATWNLSVDKALSHISVVVKDTTGKFVVGRFTIVPTIETSTSTSVNNQTLVISAGDTNLIDYTINDGAIDLDKYKGSMGKSADDKTFTEEIGTYHAGWTNYLYDVSSTKYKEGLTIDYDGKITGLQNQNPWGDITVAAKLQYKPQDKTLTTFIEYFEWKNAFFGDDFENYSDLKNEINNAKIRIVLSDNTQDVNQPEIGNNGDIINVAYGSTVTIKFQQECANGTWVDFGSTSHACLRSTAIETLSEDILSALASDGTYSDDSVTYVLSEGATLSKESESWKLSEGGSITHEFTPSFAYEVSTTKSVDLTLVKESGESGSETYGLTLAADNQQLQAAYGTLGFSSYADFKASITSCSVSSGSVEVEDSGISITGSSSSSATLSITCKVTKQLNVNNDNITINPLSIGENTGFDTLAKALFGASATTILDYSTWSDVIDDCDVAWSGYSDTYQTFGGSKNIRLTLTTKAAAHTGTFYIVNQEADKSTVHATGNLKNIDENIESDFTKTVENTETGEDEKKDINEVVNVGSAESPIWVLPKATTKKLTKASGSTSGTEGSSIAEGGAGEEAGSSTETGAGEEAGSSSTTPSTGESKLKELIKTHFGLDLDNNTSAITFKFEDNEPAEFDVLFDNSLSTAAELKNDNKLPFNTITVYQNNYAIGKIHIYLKDYSGDKSGDLSTGWKIAEKTLNKDGEIDVFHIDGKLGQETEGGVTEEGNATLKFVITSDESEVKYLTTTLNWTETIEGKNVEHIEFLTQNVQMDNDEHIFNNGLRVQYANPNANPTLILQMTKRNSDDVDKMFKFKFEEKTFKFELQDSGTIDMGASYYEGLVDLIKQPSSDSREKGERVYKAEKIANANGETEADDVIYKDRIVGTDFNFDKWEYFTSYQDQNGQTLEGKGQKVVIGNMHPSNNTLTIVINNIVDNQETIDGYTLKVSLGASPLVSIIGGNGSTTASESDPIDGGSIASEQEKEIDLSSEVFRTESGEIKFTSSLGADETVEDEDKDAKIVQVLFDAGALSYLKGVWTPSEGEPIESQIFKFEKTDSASTKISIILNGVAYEIQDLTLVDSSALGEGEFKLELNKDLYNFAAETKTSTTTEGETRDFEITITSVFSYEYDIDKNGDYVVVDDTKLNEAGKLKVTGVFKLEEKAVQIKFTIYRGKNSSRQKLAVAYYNLAVKPSFTSTITYPTISVKAEGENGEVTPTDEQMTTELFYVGTGAFDVNEAADLSINNTPRIAVTKHAYGTATLKTSASTPKPTPTPCEVIYEGDRDGGTIKKIKIGDGAWQEGVNKTFSSQGEANLSIDLSVDSSDYTISIYIPTLEVQYTATSTQPIILDEGNKQTTAVTSTDGKFSFSFDSLSIAQADVIISVQAVENGNAYTFGQYKFTVSKTPVITLKTTTVDSHMDNGNEILPINGGADLKPFDTTESDSYGYVNNTPRVQFVYNNKILSDVYLTEIKAFKVGESSGVELTSFSVSKNTIEEGEVSFKYGTQDIFGTYKYATQWDYKLNPAGLNTIEIDDGTGNLVTCYELKAGKTYDNIIKTFGITKFFGEKDCFDNLVVELVGTTNCAQISSDKSLILYGAPNGGKAIKIKVYPFGTGVGEPEIIGIKIMPKINFHIEYKKGTTFEGDLTSNNNYGLISHTKNESNQIVYEDILKDFYISEDGTAISNYAQYTFTIEEDDNLDASIEVVNANPTKITLTIKKPPVLDKKRVIIKISDAYGYVEYLKYVVAAETQVGDPTGEITFETGQTIKWTSEQPFPFSFKKIDGQADQLTSFYEATIAGAKETKVDGKTESNVSDGNGSESSLRATTETDGRLYGVQLDSVITKTTTDGSGKTESYYIPFEAGSSILFDTYKLIAVDKAGGPITLQSFDSYKNYYFKITYGESTTKSGKLDSDDIKGLLSESGAFKPQLKPQLEPESANTYYTDYKIEFYKTEPTEESTKADVTIAFNALLVTKTDKLYYASRENPDDCYTFSYSIKVEGEEFVESTGKIKNVGNKQYGAASALNTTLVISVYKGETLIDTVDVGILLKFGIYPKITQKNSALTSYDYVGLGDDIKSKLDGLTGGTNPSIKLDGADGANAPTYYKVLGDAGSSISEPYPAQSMRNGTLTSDVEYDPTSRILTLKTTLDSNAATLNNIKYTYHSSSQKLTIGYKDVTLIDGEYVDELEGITYAVDGSSLKVSKKIDNAGKARINNKEYTVTTTNSTTTVTYTTLYESIFVVWEYQENTYWGQWNYKVVDKFNSVIAGSHVSVADGTFNVKLDWVSADGMWRFNANTWVLTGSSDGPDINVSYKSTVGNSGYYVTIDGTEYKIVVSSDGKMTFQAENGAKYPNISTSGEGSTATALELTEEKTTNSSWADAINLTGLDGETTSLKNALEAKKNCVNIQGKEYTITDGKVTIDGTEYTITDGKVTIGEGESATTITVAKVLTLKVDGSDVESVAIDDAGLSGKNYSINISYVGSTLKINGKDIIISFTSMTF